MLTDNIYLITFWQTILGLLDDWEIKGLWALTLTWEQIQTDPFVDFEKWLATNMVCANMDF